MQGLFPSAPLFREHLHGKTPVREWIAPALACRNRYGIYKQLPPGQPTCLHVEIIRFDEGIERCIAAVYGERAYVIHYEFKAHTRAGE